MKTVLMVLIPLLVMAVVVPAQAQQVLDPGSAPQYFVHPLATSKTYVNSQADTSAAITVGGLSKLAYNVYYADSAVTKIYVDYRILGDATWTLKDSTSVTTTAAARAGWVLRDAITDKVPGLKIQIRFRRAFSASNNGVTSARYSDELDWKP